MVLGLSLLVCCVILGCAFAFIGFFECLVFLCLRYVGFSFVVLWFKLCVGLVFVISVYC